MKLSHLLCSTILLSFCLTLPQIGQAQAKDNDITHTELRNFDAYLDQHQDVRADLQRNPKLIDDPGYLQKHPHLKDFLEHHPNTRAELRENPNFFMQRENGYERTEDSNRITQSEVKNWDDYLDKHPAVQRDLAKNPKLADDPNYLSKHPDLKEFLEQHPNTRRELQQHPYAMNQHEKQFEKSEKKK